MQKIGRHIPYDTELKIAKRQFNKYKGQLSRDSNNTDRRIRFVREGRLHEKNGIQSEKEVSGIEAA